MYKCIFEKNIPSSRTERSIEIYPGIIPGENNSPDEFIKIDCIVNNNHTVFDFTDDEIIELRNVLTNIINMRKNNIQSITDAQVVE